MNGRAWTRAEIDRLCRTVAEGGNTIALGLALRRTHEAVITKAKRLGLVFPQAVEEWEGRSMIEGATGARARTIGCP